MTYTHQSGSFEAKPSSVQQIGRVNPANRNGTAWQVAPYICCCPLCCWLDYIIIDVDSAIDAALNGDCGDIDTVLNEERGVST